MKQKLNFLIFFLPIIILTNVPLIVGLSNSIFYLNKTVNQSGEYWRFITHPFAHLSLYHMITDLLIFFLLSYELISLPKNKYYFVLIFSFILSSITAWLYMPLYQIDAFAGISGINYGLITYYCLNKFNVINKAENESMFYGAVIIILIAKPIFDIFLPQLSISTYHFGFVGKVIPESHSAGILASLIIVLIEITLKKIQRTYPTNRLNSI